MFDVSVYGIKDDKATRAATARVQAYLRIGENEQQRLIAHCAANIPKDRYVHPRCMKFAADPTNASSPTYITYTMGRGRSAETLSVHKHALGQLCQLVKIPADYKNTLSLPSEHARGQQLLAYNLNELFDMRTFFNRLRKEAEFLHRIVNGELRAVLTQSYNRHLVSTAVLQPFLAVCKEVGLQPAKATVSDMKVHLQTYLPFAFQPISGEFVALGTCWTNSDFGQGKLRISHSILRLNGGGNLITEDAFSRMHIGSVVQDTDLRMSDEVAAKELEVVAAATRSAVLEVMQPESVYKLLTAIQRAALEQVPWLKLKDQLSKILSKEDLGTVESMMEMAIDDLPPPGTGNDGQPLPSRWWAAAALSHLAEKATDPTKSMDLKAAAGAFLSSGK